MSFFFGSQKSAAPNPLETIEKLCDRVLTSTLLADRRAAVLSLKGLARDYKLDVGTKGMPALINVLKCDRMDIDIIKAALEALQTLLAPEKDPAKDNLGLMFSEIYIKNPENVTILLDILEEQDFYIRFDVIQLLSTLLANKTAAFQDAILTSPTGIARLIDLMDDRREIIRNEGLLLLISLTKSSPDIQKIIAFQNAFDQLFRIIFEEGSAEGGIVVHDCIHLMMNLLQFNVSNQTLFRENGCIQRLAQMFLLTNENGNKIPLYQTEHWHNEQKTLNTTAMIHLVRVLVGVNNPNVTLNQNIMKSTQLIEILSRLCADASVPGRVREEALKTFGDLIRGNTEIQKKYLPFDMTAEHQISVASLLTMVFLDRADIAFKHAAFYVLTAFLHDQPDHQVQLMQIIQSNVAEMHDGDASMNSSDVTIGEMIIESIFEPGKKDKFKLWFAFSLLMHCCRENDKAKHLFLDTRFKSDDQEDGVLLIDKCCFLMISSSLDASMTETWLPLGCLSFLCVLLYEFPDAVAHFVSEGSHVQYLMEQTIQSSAGDPAIQGLTAFLMAICYEFGVESDANVAFSRPALQSIVNSRIGTDVFTGRIERLKTSKYLNSSVSQDRGLELSLDPVFVDLFKVYADVLVRNITTSRSKTKKKEDPEMLKKVAEIAELRKQLETAHEQIKAMEQQRNVAQFHLSEDTIKLEAELKALKIQYEDLSQEQEDLLVCLADQDIKMKEYKRRLVLLGEVVTDDEDD